MGNLFGQGIRFLQSLLDVDPTNKADGKGLIYRSASGKHEYETIGALINNNTKILYVDKAGNDSTGVGKYHNPFLTIAKAITVAKTYSPSYTNPVAIFIGPGEYDEQVLIDYAGIHLVGYGQYVTRLKRAGTCLTISDNGSDPEPHDLKIIGMSIESTTSDYSVVIQGIAGTSLCGNELLVKDCAIRGTNSIHANIVNYLDFQNAYVTGAELYEQTSGIWIEHSQRDGSITVDWNNAGTKPSDTSHYGVNFIGAYVPTDPTLLNNGIIGSQDLRLNKFSTSSSGHVIQDEGTPLTQRNNLNFIGAGVTATDNAGTGATDITIPGGGGGGGLSEFFRAYNSSGQSIPAGGTPTAIVFDGEEFSNSDFVPATGIYTAPSTGIYDFNFIASVQPSAGDNTDVTFVLVKNFPSSPVLLSSYYGVVPATWYVISFIANNIQLTAGDTIKMIAIYSSATDTLDLKPTAAGFIYNYFEGRKVA